MPDYKEIPNKWIRKAVYDKLNGTTVNGVNIGFHDFRITVDEAPEAYVLITGQSCNPASTKCGYDWNAILQLEVITQYKASGNTGSRLSNDNVVDMIRAGFVDTIVLDAASNLKNIRQNFTVGVGATQKLTNYIVYRTPITAEFYIV